MNSKINIPFNVINRSVRHWEINREIPWSQLSYLRSLTLINTIYTMYAQVNNRFQEYKTGGKFFFFIHCLTTSMFKRSSRYVAGKHQILTTMNISGSRVIHIVIVLCLPLPSVWHLSCISKSSQNWRQDLFQKWVVSANADTILVAINKRSNTNINEGN